MANEEQITLTLTRDEYDELLHVLMDEESRVKNMYFHQDEMDLEDALKRLHVRIRGLRQKIQGQH